MHEHATDIVRRSMHEFSSSYDRWFRAANDLAENYSIEKATVLLSDHMADDMIASSPCDAGVYDELIAFALQLVDWRQIASEFINEMREDECWPQE